MIAEDRETTLEIPVKIITIPFAYLGCRKVAEARSRRKVKPVEPEVLPPARPLGLPTTDIERAVCAALILAGQPVNNRRLAELMGCSLRKPRAVSPGSRALSARPARDERFSSRCTEN